LGVSPFSPPPPPKRCFLFFGPIRNSREVCFFSKTFFPLSPPPKPFCVPPPSPGPKVWLGFFPKFGVPGFGTVCAKWFCRETKKKARRAFLTKIFPSSPIYSGAPKKIFFPPFQTSLGWFLPAQTPFPPPPPPHQRFLFFYRASSTLFFKKTPNPWWDGAPIKFFFFGFFLCWGGFFFLPFLGGGLEPQKKPPQTFSCLFCAHLFSSPPLWSQDFLSRLERAFKVLNFTLWLVLQLKKPYPCPLWLGEGGVCPPLCT